MKKTIVIACVLLAGFCLNVAGAEPDPSNSCAKPAPPRSYVGASVPQPKVIGVPASKKGKQKKSWRLWVPFVLDF